MRAHTCKKQVNKKTLFDENFDDFSSHTISTCQGPGTPMLKQIHFPSTAPSSPRRKIEEVHCGKLLREINDRMWEA